MKNLKFYFLAFFSMSLFFQCTGDPLVDAKTKKSDGTIAIRSTENLCIASWNTQLFDVGDLFGGPQCEGPECDIRAKELCSQIAEMMEPMPDVVNFQEVFEADAAEALIGCMISKGYAYNTGFDASTNTPDCWNPFGAFNGETEGSGLITFSKLPIVKTTTEDFTDCNGCTSGGNDCFADKGMLLTEIEVRPGCTISNLNTHLDSGDGDDDVEARASQLAQMKAFLDANTTADDVLVLSGDFNIDRNTPEYNTMLSLLGNPDNTADLAGEPDGVTSESGITIDYILGQNLSSSTYKVFYQKTVCWWEYQEVIRSGPISPDLAIHWTELEANGLNLGNIDSETIVQYSVVKHVYHTWNEIPDDRKHKVKRRCNTYEVEEQGEAETTCGYYLNLSIGLFINTLIEIYDLSFYHADLSDVPSHLQSFFVYDCQTQQIDYMNPSDHNPILSCVEFECE